MTRVETPSISVLMPVYNGGRFLHEAVQSILGQGFSDFEFIIVDDGSTDQTAEILLGFEKADRRIRIVSRPNTGIVGALNDGLDRCRAEFIARMDADDISLPTRLGKQHRYLRDNPDVVLVGSWIFAIDPWGHKLGTFGAKSEGPLGDPDDPVTRILNLGTFLLHPAVMMRRSAVQRAGGYCKEFEWVEDLDLYQRMSKLGKVACLDKPLLKYRLNFNRVSTSRASVQAMRRQELANRVCRERGFPLGPTGAVQPLLASTPSPRSPGQIVEDLRTWSAIASRSGHPLTAVNLALRALWKDPGYRSSWWTLGVAILGPRAGVALMTRLNRLRKVIA